MEDERTPEFLLRALCRLGYGYGLSLAGLLEEAV